MARDFDGKTGTQLRLMLADETAAHDLKDIAKGGIAILSFIGGSDNVDANVKKLIDLLKKIEIHQKAQALTVAINWSDNDLLEVIKTALEMATADVKRGYF